MTQSENVAYELTDIIDTREEQPPIWVAYPGSKTFEVLLVPLGNKQSQIINEAQTIEWDTALMKKKVVLDSEKYQELFCEAFIKDWRGLTGADLHRLVLVKNFKILRGKTKKEFGCDLAAKKLLMTHSPAFAAWVNVSCGNIEMFNIEREEQLEKK